MAPKDGRLDACAGSGPAEFHITSWWFLASTWYCLNFQTLPWPVPTDHSYSSPAKLSLTCARKAWVQIPTLLQASLGDLRRMTPFQHNLPCKVVVKGREILSANMALSCLEERWDIGGFGCLVPQPSTWCRQLNKRFGEVLPKHQSHRKETSVHQQARYKC